MRPTLNMTRVVPASRRDVFRAMTDAGELAQWWGPRGFTTARVDLDPRPGGKLLIEMQPPQGEAFKLSGEFLQVEAPQLLTYTFRWDPPDPDDRETVVTLSLEERNGQTE